jgi:hypothetical protein
MSTQATPVTIPQEQVRHLIQKIHTEQSQSDDGEFNVPSALVTGMAEGLLEVGKNDGLRHQIESCIDAAGWA